MRRSVCRLACSGQRTAPIGDLTADSGPADPTACSCKRRAQAVRLHDVKLVKVPGPRPSGGPPSRTAEPRDHRQTAQLPLSQAAALTTTWRTQQTTRWTARRGPRAAVLLQSARLGPSQPATRGYQSANAPALALASSAARQNGPLHATACEHALPHNCTSCQPSILEAAGRMCGW